MTHSSSEPPTSTAYLTRHDVHHGMRYRCYVPHDASAPQHSGIFVTDPYADEQESLLVDIVDSEIGECTIELCMLGITPSHTGDYTTPYRCIDITDEEE